MRNSTKLFKDLVNDTADVWNLKMAKDLGVDVEYLKSTIMVKENLSNNEDRIHLDITKTNINELAKKQTEVDAESNIAIDGNVRLYAGRSLNKYVLRINDGDRYVDSIACTGKIIVGIDFTGADLIDSYFCECVFFNCSFKSAQLSTVVFVGCIFNDCTLPNCDFTGSVFTRCRFMESNLDRVSFEYTTFTDSLFISCQMLGVNYFQSKIINSGFNDCHGITSSFKDVAFISSSISISDFVDTDFRNVSFIDVIIIHSDLRGCSFDGAVATCVTSIDTKIDGKFKYLLEMNHALFSPSMHEWELNPDRDLNDDGGELDDMIGPYPNPDNDDFDKPWLK